AKDEFRVLPASDLVAAGACLYGTRKTVGERAVFVHWCGEGVLEFLPEPAAPRRTPPPRSSAPRAGARSTRARRQRRTQRREVTATEGPSARASARTEDVRTRDRGRSIARLGANERVTRSSELAARGF